MDVAMALAGLFCLVLFGFALGGAFADMLALRRFDRMVAAWKGAYEALQAERDRLRARLDRIEEAVGAEDE